MGKIDTNAPLIHKTREMIKILNIYLNHFPNHEKYGLSQQIRNSAYKMYGLIVECLKKYYKKTTLTELDIENEKLKMYVNLGFELGYFKYKNNLKDCSDNEAFRRYSFLSNMLKEIGAMIGGWIIQFNKSNRVVS